MSARLTIEVSAGRKAIFLGDYSAFPITHYLSDELALYYGQDKRTRTSRPTAWNHWLRISRDQLPSRLELEASTSALQCVHRLTN